MTKEEIIEDLCAKGIISNIGDNYFITEKYKELLAGETKLDMPELPKTNKRLLYDDLLNTNTNGNSWPIEILESKGRARAVAFMNACEVPSIAEKGRYRLKGLSTEAVNVIGNIIDSTDISPATMIEAVTLYYKYTEHPKSVKNFVLEGDILDVYQEHIKGELIHNLSGDKEDSQRTWH